MFGQPPDLIDGSRLTPIVGTTPALGDRRMTIAIEPRLSATYQATRELQPARRRRDLRPAVRRDRPVRRVWQPDGEAETETFADDVWTTPDAGPAYLWVVVRDSRGGVAFAGYAVTIAP